MSPSPMSIPAVERAETLLRHCLANRQLVPQRELAALAREHGIGRWPLYRAKQRLGVLACRRGFGRGAHYVWALPESETERALRAAAEGRATHDSKRYHGLPESVGRDVDETPHGLPLDQRA